MATLSQAVPEDLWVVGLINRCGPLLSDLLQGNKPEGRNPIIVGILECFLPNNDGKVSDKAPEELLPILAEHMLFYFDTFHPFFSEGKDGLDSYKMETMPEAEKRYLAFAEPIFGLKNASEKLTDLQVSIIGLLFQALRKKMKSEISFYYGVLSPELQSSLKAVVFVSEVESKLHFLKALLVDERFCTGGLDLGHWQLLLKLGDPLVGAKNEENSEGVHTE
ncbi:hypothetical protein BJ508DRAFT_330435 [Ascobolus immersus RN42]|uniref:Uncharacterized protein n=1 Tax=Ascobolus immersus RN42 TaxID=1160509 RepID=A0A3N4HTD9_ASCIM|nr:hypothetical protein BJ508DRAFT_330435 [Ascobolus immersus RN42]